MLKLVLLLACELALIWALLLVSPLTTTPMLALALARMRCTGQRPLLLVVAVVGGQS